MIPNIENKVEEIGIFYESTGLTPMEARVFALLLLSDPPEQDFYAIQDFLHASKSTVSNALKRLINEGRIDYITRPGDRKRYFRISPQRWLSEMQSRIGNMSPTVDVMRKVIEIRSDADTPAFNEELCSILRYLEYLNEELPQVVANWDPEDGPKSEDC